MSESIRERYRSLTTRISNFSQLSPYQKSVLRDEANELIIDDINNEFANDADYKAFYQAFMDQFSIKGKV